MTWRDLIEAVAFVIVVALAIALALGIILCMTGCAAAQTAPIPIGFVSPVKSPRGMMPLMIIAESMTNQPGHVVLAWDNDTNVSCWAVLEYTNTNYNAAWLQTFWGVDSNTITLPLDQPQAYFLVAKGCEYHDDGTFFARNVTARLAP